jgi:HAD superfamily hydrolase (TIGR01549 family)
MQRLALFDLDNTLVDRQAAFGDWAAEFAGAHGLDAGGLAWILDVDSGIEGPKGPLFHALQDRFGTAETADELWRQYRRRMPELARCRPEDRVALGRLRSAGWRIGIVTNGMTDNQLGKIRRTGLDRLVDAWCISDEVGIRKPDPRIFDLAARKCGATPGQGGWMVGDDPVADVLGGHDAGLRTILVGSQTASAPRADAVAASVAEAVDRILS